ncbi:MULTISPECIES: hypothetical protein [Antrihabitans]|uniref:Uncharacterized protein n=2 Tax=Antrihabitans TaxID=2799491 RepID=A0A934NQJ8_9NOCA|nr:hypothetical protein [Antrihabitans stalagmiti]MBJ8339611.1 hypothetical protein [Antrihabitans stalagmiti]
MNSRRATVFRVEDDGLDAAAFIAGVRRVVLANAQFDSVVTAAIVRHIDFLLTASEVNDRDLRLEERASQIEAALRSVLPLEGDTASPNTAQFKTFMAKSKPKD